MGISIITNKLPSWLATREPTLQDLIKSGTAEELKNLVIKDELSVNKKLPNGEFPLHLAIYENKPEIVLKLLEMQADPELKNSEGLSAIDVAVLMKNDGLLAHILGHKLGKDFKEIELQIKDKGSAFHVRELQNRLSKLTNFNKNHMSELVQAIIKGDVEKVRSHLTSANKNALDAAGLAPIHYAVLAGETEMIDLLLENGVDVNLCSREGDTPLHMAALQKSVSGINKLIEKGAKPDSQNIYGQTPLHYACAKEDFAAVIALVQGKANIQLWDKQGLNPLALMGATAYARDPLALPATQQLMALSATFAASLITGVEMGYMRQTRDIEDLFRIPLFLNEFSEFLNGVQSSKSKLGNALVSFAYGLELATAGRIEGPLYQAWATYHVAKTSFQGIKKSSKYLGYRNGAALRNILAYATSTAFSLFHMTALIQEACKTYSSEKSSYSNSQGSSNSGGYHDFEVPREDGCSEIKAQDLTGLSTLDRIMTEKLNPKCPQDACMILSAGCTLDAAKADGGKKYVGDLYRKAAREVHPNQFADREKFTELDRTKANDATVKLNNARDNLLDHLNLKKPQRFRNKDSDEES